MAASNADPVSLVEAVIAVACGTQSRYFRRCVFAASLELRPLHLSSWLRPSASAACQASINTLLNRVGISAKPINSFEELRKSASSMFVAIFEAMFQV